LNALAAEHEAELALEPRAEPSGGRPDLVFFQHDEVIVHAPQVLAEAVIAAISASGEEATRLVVGDRGVHVPLTGVPVASYADKT
jgi:DNA polymerase-1